MDRKHFGTALFFRLLRRLLRWRRDAAARARRRTPFSRCPVCELTIHACPTLMGGADSIQWMVCICCGQVQAVENGRVRALDSNEIAALSCGSTEPLRVARNIQRYLRLRPLLRLPASCKVACAPERIAAPETRP